MLHKLLSGALLLAIFFVAQANAQPNSTTINPSLTIVQPITITKTVGKDLLFGKFSAYVSARGTVILTVDGQRSKTGDITLIEGVTYGAAEFKVEGMADATFDLTLPTTATLTNNQYDMTVSNFVTSIIGTPTIGSNGSLTFTVGATLTKDVDTPRGTYAGTFSLTVNYQ